MSAALICRDLTVRLSTATKTGEIGEPNLESNRQEVGPPLLEEAPEENDERFHELVAHCCQPEVQCRVVECLLSGRSEDDEPFLGKHIRCYRRELLRYIERGLRHSEHAQDAEDIAQEAWLSAQTKLDELDDPKLFLGWLMGHARYLILRRMGRAHNQTAKAESIDGKEIIAPESKEHRRKEEWEMAQLILDALPAADRHLHELDFFDGKKDKEIAELLGIPVGTVKSRKSAARKRGKDVALALNLEPAA